MKILLYMYSNSPLIIHSMIPKKNYKGFLKRPKPTTLQGKIDLVNLVKKYLDDYDDPFINEIDYILTIESSSKNDVCIEKIGTIYSEIFHYDYEIVDHDTFWKMYPQNFE